MIWFVMSAWAGDHDEALAEVGTPSVAVAQDEAPSEVAPKVEPNPQYELGPDDQLNIEVWGESELSAKYTVDQSGLIQFPFLGGVNVMDKTVGQVTQVLTDRLSESYITEPHVTVSLAARGSKRVDVLGAVAKPGAYYIRGGTRLLDVLSSAGGIKGDGITEIRVQRDDGPITIQAEDLLMTGAGDIVIKTGDRIVVPKGPVVYAAGQVKTTGSYEFRDGMTVTQLLSAAGGPLNTANLRSAYILRDGERIPLNMRKIIKGRSADVVVEPGDQLFVQESVF